MTKKHFSFALGLVFLATPFVVFAHEHQTFRVGGEVYEFTIGSLNEPIAVDDKTGVELRVKEVHEGLEEGDHHDAAEGAVVGLEQTLKVELVAGDKKKVLDLTPAYNDPGAYRANFFPTVQTTYSYRFFGTINGVPVDFIGTCNPAGHPRAEADTKETLISEGFVRLKKEGAFGCPVAKADLGFPESSSSVNDLQKQIGSMSDKVAMVGTIKMKSMVALALGLIALVIAVLALRKKKSA